MTGLIKKFIANDKIRYLVAGGCTTFVNLIAFFLLRRFTNVDRNVCNVIAIIMAITFAYFANKFFVFRSKTESPVAAVFEAVSFVGARLISMAVEVIGFALLCDSFRLNEVVSKLAVQVVVLVLNYMFSKLFIFKKRRRSLEEIIKENYSCYMSFLIVAVTMLAVCIAEKVTPFGNKSLTLVDSLHQYLPFFSEYRDKLLNERSLFYTWNIALGSNFVSLSAYYLSSPFNLLLLLFDKMHIATGITVILILKIGLSASCMAYYLSNKGGKLHRHPSIIAIAVCYAFSNYVIGYNWNVMWLDCIMIFPLIILGFERLMETGDPKMYTLSLFYCLYCNYYIGFIICVFMVLWFFVYSHHNIKKFFAHGVRFAIYSLLGGAMAAFMLIPAYLGIMSTASADAKLPEWSWYGNIFEMFKQQLFLTKPITNQTFDGGVNLYCGMFAIYAVFLYLFNRKVKLWDKFGKVILLAILMISFNSTTLNFVWHGFHDQYGIPNRFSFLYIFVLLVIADEVIKKIRHLNTIYVIAAGLLTAVFICLCKIEVTSGISTTIIIASFAVLFVYVLLCVLRSRGILNKKAFQITFALICSVELVVSATVGFGENGTASYGEKYATTDTVTQANEYVDLLADLENAGFYRSELMAYKVLDEATWHNMPSVGTFCSTVLGEVVTTMGKLGFYTGANEFLYMGSTPLTNSLFNVRYLLERQDDLNNYDFIYVDRINDIGVYENPYPLALGFSVSDSVKDWDRASGLPLDNQNSLVYAMTGGLNIFTPVYPGFIVSSDDCSTTVSGEDINFTPYQSGDVSITTSFYINKTGDYYVNCRGNYVDKIRFFIDGEEMAYDRYQIQIFHLGWLQEGDYITIEYVYNDLNVSSEVAHIHLAIFDELAYRDIYNKLSLNMLNVDCYEDGYVSGNITIPDGETMFTSIPYDEGWTVKVDGRKADYYTVCGAFIGVDMEPGEHEIEMIYTPRGLYMGILIALCGWTFFMLGVMHNTNKKQGAKLVKNTNNKIDHELNI